MNKRNISYERLDFIFVVAVENNRAPDTDLSSRMGLIVGGIIHLRNISKFYLWKKGQQN